MAKLKFFTQFFEQTPALEAGHAIFEIRDELLRPWQGALHCIGRTRLANHVQQ